MKKILLVLVLVIPTLGASAVTLTGFDVSSYTLFGDTGNVVASQGASSLDISGQDGGVIEGNLGSPFDFAGLSGAGGRLLLSGSVTADPGTSFNIRLYESVFDSGIYADFTGGSFATLNSTGQVFLDFSATVGGFDFSDVQGIDIIFNGLGDTAVGAAFTSLELVAVPEPSTFAAFAGLFVLGFVAVCRRR